MFLMLYPPFVSAPPIDDMTAPPPSYESLISDKR